MRPRSSSRPHLSRWARYSWLAAVPAAAAFAFAGVGAAAQPGSADLRITKTDSPDPVAIGSTLTYSIQIQNLGPEAATGVNVTDRLPKGVDLVSAIATQGQCAQHGRLVSCSLGTIAAPTVNYSGPPTVTLTVVPRRSGTITNTATVRGGQKDPVASNNRATTTTLVVGPTGTCRGVPATIAGTVGNDTIVGTGGRDVIAVFGGDDRVFSLAGRDLICTGGGNDFAGAGTAADRVFGGNGRDRLLGRGGPDVLKGNRGGDVLRGNRGADRLRGGAGRDRCLGGAGLDSARGCER
jgi:uncharacterized repeat protein (TIGR01451 family)